MHYEVTFFEKIGFFYILILTPSGNAYTHDLHIANILDMSINTYQDYLIEYFDAYVSQCEIYFETQENVEQAVDWINSVLIANKLMGV